MGYAWRLGSVALVLWVLACLGGCSDYVGSYQYFPRPAMAYVRPSTTAPSPTVSALASVIGVRRADDKLGIPTSVEVHLRIDNLGSQPVILDPNSLALTDGSLSSFPPPVVRPNQALTVAPSQSGVVTAYFPFPPGRSYDDTNMESLQLRWTLQIGGQAVPFVFPFYRVYPVYYYY